MTSLDNYVDFPIVLIKYKGFLLHLFLYLPPLERTTRVNHRIAKSEINNSASEKWRQQNSNLPENERPYFSSRKEKTVALRERNKKDKYPHLFM